MQEGRREGEIQLILDNIISHIHIHPKKATVFPGKPLLSRMRQPFTIEYSGDIDLRQLDLSIVITPFLLNVIPLLWFLGGTYKVDSMDKDMFESLKLVKDGLQNLYPQVPWKGEVVPDQITERKQYKNTSSLKQVLFFSGGMDSTYSAIKADPDKTVLLTIRGHEITLENDQTWKTICDQVDNFALPFGFRTTRVSANVFRLLRCGDIHQDYPELKPWYGMVQHGPGLAGLAFPLAVYNGWEKVIFSSSVGENATHVPWGSHPFLEPRIQVNGVKVISEGTELIWADKVLAIVDFFRHNPNLTKPLLRICLDDMNGNAVSNCALCEKCLRGMVSLMIGSEDPSEWGFPIVHPIFGSVKECLLTMTIPESNKYIWDRMHSLALKAFPESKGDYRQFINWYINWYGRECLV